MRLSILQPHPHPHRIKRWPRIDASSFHRRKDKVVVIMGATGSGKSRLSIDLATLFPSSEIINSDKMQVYRGLDITTNKIPPAQRRGVPHHLLGDVDTDHHGEFSPADFRHRAADLIADITRRKNLPIVVGGSNSFVHALLVQNFDPHSHSNVFQQQGLISSELRYMCCFLWVDIALPVLSQYLRDRVDDMLNSGMVDELAQFFDQDAARRTGFGLRKAIGVPEFDRFFNKYPPSMSQGDDPLRESAYQEAVRAIKDNTCELAERQIGKIERLKRAGWDLRRIDATEAFRGVLTSGSDVWERQVLEPSVKIVKRFLRE
ncbi:Adenylate isopentenyltransferase [Glycine soja]|uniref:Adenylate isopentenyltransferase n=1 Tax=Glycine soja TaxID=3848 RepID=A0A445F3M4_GLYSO|nr:adenylate isopentenyltransferase-like [Glycine soja]RZB43451.1 Adenylate isopentenyltransferase [Glycine soja]